MKFLKPVLLLSLFMTVALNSCYNEAPAGDEKKALDKIAELQWHTIEDLKDLQKKSPKLVIVDVYTDWCRWCKVMDKQTFTDPALIKHLSSNYHMVKFNAENKSSLTFKGKTYDFVQSGRRGYNELAAELCQGRLSYPSFVVLDRDLNRMGIVSGFKQAPKFREALDQIGGTNNDAAL